MILSRTWPTTLTRTYEVRIVKLRILMSRELPCQPEKQLCQSLTGQILHGVVVRPIG